MLQLHDIRYFTVNKYDFVLEYIEHYRTHREYIVYSILQKDLDEGDFEDKFPFESYGYGFKPTWRKDLYFTSEEEVEEFIIQDVTQNILKWFEETKIRRHYEKLWAMGSEDSANIDDPRNSVTNRLDKEDYLMYLDGYYGIYYNSSNSHYPEDK